MTTTFPGPTNPNYPPGFPNKVGKIDWTTRKLIHAITTGIDEPVDDPLLGHIPAGRPLPLEKAARAVGYRLKRARRIQHDPDFQTALREATEALRACQEPQNLAVAMEIRDTETNRPKDRLAAGNFIRGPRPERALVNVNVNQSAISPGYCIVLREPAEPDVTIDHQANVDFSATRPTSSQHHLTAPSARLPATLPRSTGSWIGRGHSSGHALRSPGPHCPKDVAPQAGAAPCDLRKSAKKVAALMPQEESQPEVAYGDGSSMIPPHTNEKADPERIRDTQHAGQ